MFTFASIYNLNIDHNTPTQFIRSHEYHTRQRDNLLPPHARLTLTQNSMSVVGPNIWNSIPEDIRNSPSRNSFKFNCKRFLLSSYIQTD